MMVQSMRKGEGEKIKKQQSGYWKKKVDEKKAQHNIEQEEGIEMFDEKTETNENDTIRIEQQQKHQQKPELLQKRDLGLAITPGFMIMKYTISSTKSCESALKPG